MIFCRNIVSLHGIPLFFGFLGMAMIVCGPKSSKDHPALTAELTKDQDRLFLLVRNYSTSEFQICKKNVYDAIECLDIRRYPDTAELPPERVFGRQRAPVERSLITVSDYTPLGPGQEVKLPVDMRYIRFDRALGDTAFLAVYFKNIDPFSCSKAEAANCDKATQEYCKMLHFIPARSCVYWSGEVHTPYRRVCLNSRAAAPRPKARVSSRETVVKRSRTHPLKKKVF